MTGSPSPGAATTKTSNAVLVARKTKIPFEKGNTGIKIGFKTVMF